MDNIHLKSLQIISFRHLKNVTIAFGKKLTVISGVNGIGKSCLLGLIGHMFKLKEKDSNGKEYRSLLNKKFYTDFSDIFKFSQSERGKLYSYNLTTTLGIKKASSRYLEKDKRFRIDVAKDKGGKYDFPVIYLSLKRLFPLANERTIKRGKSTINGEEEGLYASIITKILASNEILQPQVTISRNKNYIAPTTTLYDANGLSAGQDNLGQIVSALLSFKHLKAELISQGEEYFGGILLIDELDATLFPGSQLRLLDVLLKMAGDLNLQIIFTTHSLEILKKITLDDRKKFCHDCNVIFLHKVGATVKVENQENSFEAFKAELENLPWIKADNINKKDVYVEDAEAALWLKSLLPTKMHKCIEIQKISLGQDEYQYLLAKKPKWFNNSIVVLDGDAKIQKKYPNLLKLPGSNSPEVMFHNFLDNLHEDDPFWGKELGSYKKAVFISTKLTSEELKDRNKTKHWFNENLKYWGKSGSRLFKYWKEKNENLANKFIENIQNCLK